MVGRRARGVLRLRPPLVHIRWTWPCSTRRRRYGRSCPPPLVGTLTATSSCSGSAGACGGRPRGAGTRPSASTSATSPPSR
eukprot:927299-Prorocentrum_minimum.AAC.2